MKTEIHFLYARQFCRKPTLEVIASEQSLCSASIDRAVLVYIWSVYIQYTIRNAIVTEATMTSCSTAILAVKSILQIICL